VVVWVEELCGEGEGEDCFGVCVCDLEFCWYFVGYG